MASCPMMLWKRASANCIFKNTLLGLYWSQNIPLAGAPNFATKPFPSELPYNYNEPQRNVMKLGIFRISVSTVERHAANAGFMCSQHRKLELKVPFRFFNETVPLMSSPKTWVIIASGVFEQEAHTLLVGTTMSPKWLYDWAVSPCS